MVLVKLGLPNEESIVTRNNFIANEIVPIAIKEVNEKQFIMLFSVRQDYDDSMIYLQLLFKAENELEINKFTSHSLNFNKIMSNPNRKIAYEELISKMNNNVYATDLIMKEDSSHPMYYHATGVKGIDKTHASIIDLYIPRDNFIKLKVYFDKITNSNDGFDEKIFVSNKYHNIEFVNIEEVKHDGTCQIKSSNIYSSHYTMHCGPSKFVMNFISMAVVPENGNKPILSNPLDEGLYNSFYKDHFIVNDFFLDENYLYILYEEKSEIDGSFKKMKALRLIKELYDLTNFVDFGNRIFI